MAEKEKDNGDCVGKRTSASCEPGTEECYYLIAMGLCEGAKDKTNRPVKAVAWLIPRAKSHKPGMERVIITELSEKWLKKSDSQIPVVDSFTGLDARGARHVNCHGPKPRVRILEPEEDGEIPAGTTLVLKGKAHDLEDGDMSKDLTWTSDKAGELGKGSRIPATLTQRGLHTITATTDPDSDGNIGFASVKIFVT